MNVNDVHRFLREGAESAAVKAAGGVAFGITQYDGWPESMWKINVFDKTSHHRLFSFN